MALRTQQKKEKEKYSQCNRGGIYFVTVQPCNYSVQFWATRMLVRTKC
jgi:hypothetical protein